MKLMHKSVETNCGPAFSFRLKRALGMCLTASLLLVVAGCGKEAVVPLSFHLIEQEHQDSAEVVPASEAALVVTQVEMVFPEPEQRRICISLFPADARVFEKLTTDNFGKTLAVMHGTNVLAKPKILEPIPERADIMFTVSTNLDFRSVYRELSRLSQ